MKSHLDKLLYYQFGELFLLLNNKLDRLTLSKNSAKAYRLTIGALIMHALALITSIRLEHMCFLVTKALAYYSKALIL